MRSRRKRSFMRDWLCVARAEEVTNAGDYLTFRLMNEPFVVARADDGSINAYRNSCAHRGLVVAKGSGNAKGFTCAYHGWSYDLTGQLVGAPFMDDVQDFDLSTCRLPPLRCEVWAGWVFVSFNADVGPLSDDVALFESEFSLLDMGACRSGDKQVWDLACNWKIMDENNHDLYHIQATHAGTFGARHHGPKVSASTCTRAAASAPFTTTRRWCRRANRCLAQCRGCSSNPTISLASDICRQISALSGASTAYRGVLAWPVSLTETQLIVYQLFPRKSV